jgi:hypothetical protein
MPDIAHNRVTGERNVLIGVDVGGTFTDAVLTVGGESWRAKSPSTYPDIDAGQGGPEAHQVTALGARRRAAGDVGHVEAGAAKVAGQHARLARPLCDAGRRRDSGGRAGCGQPDRLFARLIDRDRAAARMAKQHRRFQPFGLQRAGKVVDPAIGAEAVGVQHRQGRALVLADHRPQLAAAGDRQVGQHFAQQGNGPAFVDRVEE